MVASVSAMAVAVTDAALCAWFSHGHVLHWANASETASAMASSAYELALLVLELVQTASRLREVPSPKCLALATLGPLVAPSARHPRRKYVIMARVCRFFTWIILIMFL